MKFLLSLTTLLLFTACSPEIFQQIATLSSENVELKDDGAFAYENELFTIEYYFWSESGKFYFTITNNSDDDLYLNLEKSYFVNNGYAYDYYQNRTFVYTNSKTTISASSVLPKNNSSIISTFGTPYIYGNGAALTSDNGISVEYAEQPLICIPALSSKSFGEFSISSSEFRDCGFIRNPTKKELAIREYTVLNSPRIIENRLVFEFNGSTVPITNLFYVSEFQNIAYNNATKYVTVENCDGTKQDVKMHMMSANNKFYITYFSNGTASDRTSQDTSPWNRIKTVFEDDIYQ